MKKILTVIILVIVALNFNGFVNLKDYIGYSYQLVSNDDISIQNALNNNEEGSPEWKAKKYVENILDRDSISPLSKVIDKKVLSDIYGSIDYEVFNNKLTISDSSWGYSGSIIPDNILDKIYGKREIFMSEEKKFMLGVLFLSSGYDDKAIDLFEEAYQVNNNDKFKVIMAIIHSNNGNLDKSKELLENIENLEFSTFQTELYNTILSGNLDKLDELTDFKKNSKKFSKEEFGENYRSFYDHRLFSDKYLKIISPVVDFNVDYLISLYGNDEKLSNKIIGKLSNDGEPMPGVFVSLNKGGSYYSSRYLMDDGFIDLTDENGEFEILVPDNNEYNLRVMTSIKSVKGKMCTFPQKVEAGGEKYEIKFMKNDFNMKVEEIEDSFEISWDKNSFFDNYTVMIGSLKYGSAINAEFYSSAIDDNKITITKEEIMDKTSISSYSMGDEGRDPKTFLPLLRTEDTYFIDLKGNMQIKGYSILEADTNGFYGDDQTYKFKINKDLSEADRDFINKNYDKALVEYEKLASEGDLSSMLILGEFYSYNDKIAGAKKEYYNPEKALEYLVEADKILYGKYSESRVDYHIKEMYEEIGQLEKYIKYIESYGSDRIDNMYGDALIDLGRFDEGYEALYIYALNNNYPWAKRNFIEKGILYGPLDRLADDIKTFGEEYVEYIEAISSMDKKLAKEYQDNVKKEGTSNIFIKGNSDTDKIYQGILKMQKGPYSPREIVEIFDEIGNSDIRKLARLFE